MYLGFSVKKITMANSVDPDETAHNELSHLDLHCFQSCLYWSVGIEGIIIIIWPTVVPTFFH